MSEPTRKPNVTLASGNAKSNTKSRLAGGKRPGTSVTWSDIPNQLLRDAIVAVADNGAAIMLGRTSDGGALSITVLDGQDKIREWPHSVDDCETTLRWLIDMFEPG